jgi:hypothetical protein
MAHIEPIIKTYNIEEIYNILLSPELTNKYIEEFDLCNTLRAKQIHFNTISDIINDIEYSLNKELSDIVLNVLGDYPNHTDIKVKQEPSIINYFRNVLSYIKFASDNYNIADDTVVDIFDEFQYNNHCMIKHILYIKYLLEIKEEYEAHKEQDADKKVCNV